MKPKQIQAKLLAIPLTHKRVDTKIMAATLQHECTEGPVTTWVDDVYTKRSGWPVGLYTVCDKCKTVWVELFDIDAESLELMFTQWVK